MLLAASCAAVSGYKRDLVACYHPLKGYRGVGGEVSFDKTAAYTDLPTIHVPCGQCSGCRLERSRQWSVRIMHEASLHDRNSFLTLTYSDENLPFHDSLDPTHFTKFAKRVRKNYGPFRYYQCGEYSPAPKWRPHHHCCAFQIDFHEDKRFHKNSPTSGLPIYTSKILDLLWTHGECYIGSLTQKSAAYVARYCMKKINGKKKEDHYSRVDTDNGECFQLKPEYATMSRGRGTTKGIASAWIEKFGSDVYPNDLVIDQDGREVRPPKYYDDTLEVEKLTTLKHKRRSKSRRHRWNNTPERLAVREKIHKSRTTTLHPERL